MHRLVVTDRTRVKLSARHLNKCSRGRGRLFHRVEPPARDRSTKGGLVVRSRRHRGADRARVLVTSADCRLINVVVKSLCQLAPDLISLRVFVRLKSVVALN